MTSLAIGRAIAGRRAAPDRRTAAEPMIAKPLYLAPAFLLLVVFFIAPAAATVAISLTDWRLGNASLAFIGLENYRALLASPDFHKSIVNTLKLNLFVVPVSFGLALAIALAIRSAGRLAGFWTAAYFLPVTSTLVAMAVVWQWLLHPEVGVAAALFRAVGWTPVNWLNDQDVVLFTIGAISVWQLLGYYVVLFLAGLATIPASLYEAARIDGARGPWDRFRHVTWPMLGPTSLFVLIIALIKSFQIFDVVKVLTRGGPDKASEIILHSLYLEGFSFFRTGTASAIATLFFAVMLALTLTQVRLLERRVHYR
jgi:multiple sugar transport system permease protein